MRLLTLFILAILVFTGCREEGVAVMTTTGISAGTNGKVFEGSLSVMTNLQNDATQTVEAVNLPVTATFRFKL